jgi:hypothetical protein
MDNFTSGLRVGGPGRPQGKLTSLCNSQLSQVSLQSGTKGINAARVEGVWIERSDPR